MTSDFPSTATFGTFTSYITGPQNTDLSTWGWFNWTDFATVMLSGTLNIPQTISGTVDIVQQLSGTLNIPQTISGTVNLE